MVTGSNIVVLGPLPQWVADGGGYQEKMADVDIAEEAAGGARDIMMAKTETATRTATDTETETDTGALATQNYCDAAQLCKVI
jgi:carbohydrate-binding DOMON domain-containing protein